MKAEKMTSNHTNRSRLHIYHMAVIIGILLIASLSAWAADKPAHPNQGSSVIAKDTRAAKPATPLAGKHGKTANDQAPLGSSDFYPSPEHTVGWRGDGSGRFPGATPPTVWSRRLADITSEIMVQAVKPTGKPGADSHVLGYFTIKDWLVAGPFPINDPEKDIDKDFLGGEAEVQPDAGDKAGDKQWKVFRANEGSQSFHTHVENTCTEMWVDFVYAFGTLVPREKPSEKPVRMPPGFDIAKYANIDKNAAYAHTYLYAPRPADVNICISHDLPAVKMWVNGLPQRVGTGKAGIIKIHLNSGWNRLLIKALCDQARARCCCYNNFEKDDWLIIKWRFAAYIRPTENNNGYTTKNIAWMTKLTGRNMSQPIVVGDKLFVGSNDTDLFCLDKRSGKILWLHTGTYWDAMTDEERAAVKDIAEPLLTELDKVNADLVALLNANITPQGLDANRQAVIDKELGKRKKFLRTLHDALSAGKKGKLYINGMFPGEASAGDATPTSDGKWVYWVVQGDGGYLTSAFDLNGKLMWSQFEYQKSGTGEHGSHSAPLLYQGKLYVCTIDSLIARDAATGKELWRTAGSGCNAVDYPTVVQFKGQPALQTSKNLVSLNGEVLVTGGYSPDCDIPVVEDGVLYNPSNGRGDYSFMAITIPKQDGDTHKVLWQLDAKTLYGPLGDFFVTYVASPLYVQGLIYQVDSTGNLVVIDTRARKRVYQRKMDGYNVNGYRLYGYCASPTLAGKNIYLMDGVGYVTLLKPGADSKVMGNNMLQNITSLPDSAPCGQEVFYAGMYFDGKRIFLHGDEYLYCVEETR